MPFRIEDGFSPHTLFTIIGIRSLNGDAHPPPGQGAQKCNEELEKKLTVVHDALIQPKISANEDSLNYPPALDAKLSYLAAHVSRGTMGRRPGEKRCNPMICVVVLGYFPVITRAALAFGLERNQRRSAVRGVPEVKAPCRDASG